MGRFLLFIMKNFITSLLILISIHSFSQNSTEVKGTIKDATTNETIIGASVLYAPGKGVVTDIDGNFSLKIDSAGVYTLTVSYVGYDSQKQKIKADGKTIVLNFLLQTQTLNEVEVVADVAKSRETPIAFANVSSRQIQEELGTRDLPMMLNSTPGVYATQSGGGSGDSRVNVRGFDQRNVAVMVDGVPVNDMENGAVFWSNWDGLSDITRTMQVQRGLGASKLAIPSVGGTINIITKGIDQKRSVNIKQEVNDYGLYKTSFGYNTGQLKGGWGFTLAGSRKWGTEWANGTYTDAWSYFGKVQKRFKKHLFSLSASGAPQSHGQRYDRLPIAVYSKKLSDQLGINSDSILRTSPYTTTHEERGLTYNPNWGTLNDNGGTSDGTINFFPKSKHGPEFNERVNYFHKPQFNLSHFWTPNEKLTVSTVIYLSVGHGGGTALKNTSGVAKDSATGMLDVQKAYDANRKAYSTTYSTTEHSSNNYLRTNNNDHIWYGIINSWNYKVNKNLNTLFGIDARSYKGSHYQSVYNLMGGDYAPDNGISDKNQPKGIYAGDPNFQYALKRVGDKVGFYNDAKVYWGGLFAQAEYKIKKWTTFITGSFSETGYQRIDYFKKKDLVIDGNTFSQSVGFGDQFYYNGTDHLTAIYGTSSSNGTSTVRVNGDTTFVGTGVNRKYILNAKQYTNESSEARYATTDLKWFIGYTVKGGANYNINDHHNVFVNLGYLNMAPLMNTVFDNNNNEYLNIKNQKVYAIEGGYGYRQQKFAANLNVYYTIWQNKPLSASAAGPNGTFFYNILGLNALHKGVEIDVVYKILKNLEFEGLLSLGDWKTTSGSKADVTDEDGNIVAKIDFSAKNVHVGDAAQHQAVGSLRYTIFKGFYIKPRYTYFAKNYSNFVPINLTDNTAGGGSNNKDRDSWRMPNYGLCDVFLGYNFDYWKLKFGITAGVLNVLNTTYITDGTNGINFDATTATVYMGMGRRYNIALRIGF
jgi:iron complex outermembrane recepter protein